ncbi:MAG: hypothetical protein AAGE01_06050 [Pseudomonadota bacterium]
MQGNALVPAHTSNRIEPQVQEALVAIVRPRLETSGYRMGQIQRTADFRTCTHHPDPRPARSALDGLLRETRRHYVARRQGAIEVEFCCGSTLYRVLVWPAAARPVVQLSEEDAADACLPDG